MTMIQILRHDDWQNGRHAESNLAATRLKFLSFALLRFFIIVTIAISNSSLPAGAQSSVSDNIKHDTPGKTIQQGQSVHIDVNMALVNVTVTGRYDRVVTRLDPDNFRKTLDRASSRLCGSRKTNSLFGSGRTDSAL